MNNLKEQLYSLMEEMQDCICCSHYIPTLNGQTFCCRLGYYKTITTKCNHFNKRENTYDGTINSIFKKGDK